MWISFTVEYTACFISPLFNWQNCLDKFGVGGTILMDLSKALDFLPHDLTIAKLHVYGLDHDSLRLIRSYLSNRHQRIKLDSVFSSWIQTIIGVPQGFFIWAFPL